MNHWADSIAQQIINLRPDKNIYVCAAGISPSGSVHIGNFRDIATVFFVGRALREQGKKVRLLFSWDEFDRFRKVPANVHKSFDQYIGKPYTAIPDPFGCHESYARHFEQEFEQSIVRFGIQLDFRYQTVEHQSGKYCENIILALKKRKQIYDILSKNRTQQASDEERELYYPIHIYCHACNKDTTKVTSLSSDCHELTYHCKCGHTSNIDLTKGGQFKLPWKVDWPMRWKHEQVDFEPGGKDHATPGGSYTVSKQISQEIFDYQPPIFQGYEFVGITGLTSKMSGSSGKAITPGELLKIYQPEILLWYFAKYSPTKAFSISLDEEILRQYDEFDRALTTFKENKAVDQAKRNIELSLIDGHEIITVPFRQLASFSTIIKGNTEALTNIFDRLGTPFTSSQFNDRLEKASYWLNTYCPESVVSLKETPNKAYFETLNPVEQQWIRNLYKKITEKNMTFEELTVMLYDIPKDQSLSEDINKTNQRRFFLIIYQLLIGKDTGPRLATFLQALDPQKISFLFDF